MSIPRDADAAAQAAVWTLLQRLGHIPADVTTVVVLQPGILVVDSGSAIWHRFAPRTPDEPAVPPPDPAGE